MVGMKMPLVEARMKLLGFDCVPSGGEKALTPVPSTQEEITCRKSERLGFGLANDNLRFLVAIFPSERLYAFLPKDSTTVTYRESNILFTFDNGILATMQPSVRLMPSNTAEIFHNLRLGTR